MTNRGWTRTGISPIHHENFDWSKMTEANKDQLGDRWAEKVGDVWYKRGAGWGESENQPLTRFSLYSDMLSETDREETPGTRRTRLRRVGTRSGACKTYKDYTFTTSQYASWQGCVEARPYPYNTDDTTPTASTPATLYVPMFAPDEAGTSLARPQSRRRDDLSCRQRRLRAMTTAGGRTGNWTIRAYWTARRTPANISASSRTDHQARGPVKARTSPAPRARSRR